MKTIHTYLIALGFLALASQVSGQDNQSKLRKDPTYSTHNYKHPNKAATARQWESKAGVAVQQPQAGNENLANYKRQVPNQAPTGGVTVDHTPSTDVADRNYKIQRISEPAAVPGSGVATKKKIRLANDTAVGD
jgi:hypothetical protein